eukprot:scaffold6478_cov124-Isochrysis_galbana.AAC.1
MAQGYMAWQGGTAGRAVAARTAWRPASDAIEGDEVADIIIRTAHRRPKPSSHGRSRGALLGHWPEGSWRRDSVGHPTERQTTRGKRSMAPKMGTLSAAMANTAARHKGGLKASGKVDRKASARSPCGGI